MLIVDDRSDYNGMYGVTHVCNRCEKAFALGDTRKKPTDLNRIEICPDCAVEMFNAENGRLNKNSMLKLRQRFSDMQSVLIMIGKAVTGHNEGLSILKENPCDDFIEMTYYWYIDDDSGCTYSFEVPYSLLHTDETWKDRLQEFVNSKPRIRKGGNV